MDPKNKKVVLVGDKAPSASDEETIMDAMGPLVVEITEDIKPYVKKIQEKMGTVMMAANGDTERSIAISAIMTAYGAILPNLLILVIADDSDNKNVEKVLAQYLGDIMKSTLETHGALFSKLKSMSPEEVKKHSDMGKKILEQNILSKKDTSYIG